MLISRPEVRVHGYLAIIHDLRSILEFKIAVRPSGLGRHSGGPDPTNPCEHVAGSQPGFPRRPRCTRVPPERQRAMPSVQSSRRALGAHESQGSVFSTLFSARSHSRKAQPTFGFLLRAHSCGPALGRSQDTDKSKEPATDSGASVGQRGESSAIPKANMDTTRREVSAP